jgi:hypothetical protein
MSTSTGSAAAISLLDPRTALGLWLRWLPTFIGFIAGGALATAVSGSVTSVPAALAGGALAGAVIGAGQWLALRGRLPKIELWIPATALGQAVGLAAGAALVGYRTDLQSLVIQGAVTGLGIGILQGLVLRPHVTSWYWWAIAMPPLWALGWVVTTAAGIGVGQQFTNFGLFGAISVTALSGLLLVQMLPSRQPIDEVVQPAAGATP